MPHSQQLSTTEVIGGGPHHYLGMSRNDDFVVSCFLFGPFALFVCLFVSKMGLEENLASIQNHGIFVDAAVTAAPAEQCGVGQCCAEYVDSQNRP